MAGVLKYLLEAEASCHVGGQGCQLLLCHVSVRHCVLLFTKHDGRCPPIDITIGRKARVVVKIWVSATPM